ncbi:MAG TPA: HPP family protein [Nitrolancea sp.]|nr:HPP family protein [Nitrolancea sp.]
MHIKMRKPSMPEPLWPPFAAGFLMLVVGVVAYVTSQPFLYPSLGPTAFLQAEYPFHRTSQFRDTSFGHVIGIVAGLAAVFALGAQSEPRVEADMRLPPRRIAAAAVTVTLVIVLQMLFKISNPPSASTGLLFALGFFQPRVIDVAEVLAGVLFMASFGALIRHFRLESPPAIPESEVVDQNEPDAAVRR